MNGPKVNPDAHRMLPLVGVIPRVQLAICWNPRESGATAKSGDNATGADNQQERPISRLGSESSETRRQPPR